MSPLSSVHHGAADRAPQIVSSPCGTTHDGVACCDAPTHRAERGRGLHRARLRVAGRRAPRQDPQRGRARLQALARRGGTRRPAVTSLHQAGVTSLSPRFDVQPARQTYTRTHLGGSFRLRSGVVSGEYFAAAACPQAVERLATRSGRSAPGSTVAAVSLAARPTRHSPDAGASCDGTGHRLLGLTAAVSVFRFPAASVAVTRSVKRG